MMANLWVIKRSGNSTRMTMDPGTPALISQLVVITLPVGTLFGLWLWMLNWGRRSQRRSDRACEPASSHLSALPYRRPPSGRSGGQGW